MELEPSGERMIMEHYRSSPEDYVIYLLHVATYRFAEKYTSGKHVLDYGCGSGYGSAMIAGSAASVVAVDVDPAAVDYAREKFPAGNLSFQAIGPAQSLPFPDNSFDTVLSFQVFEHVADTDRYLREVRRVLRPGGSFLLVTPDRSTRLLPGQKPWNRWHLHEYGSNELSRHVERHFERARMLGMTARKDMIDIELRRCRKVKWLSLPFTLPFMPDAWRVAALNWVHRARGRKGGDARPAGREYPFGIEDVVISEDATPSVNLVVIAS